jgi:hypothetical protein
LQAIRWDLLKDAGKGRTLAALMAQMLEDYDEDFETIEYMHPFALAAKTNSEDTPTWNEAMSGPDKEGYWEAMEKEYYTLEMTMDC